MKVCVEGLWHLGTVTAGCLASKEFLVVGLDFDTNTIDKLQSGLPPLYEPGLEDLIKSGINTGQLSFTIDLFQAVNGADVVWVTYDTPVDDEDQADVAFVIERVKKLFPFIAPGTLVLISSQLPVGTTRKLEELYITDFPNKIVSFAYSPENLRLGKAINAFMKPERVVVGIRKASDQDRLTDLFRPFTGQIEWMSVESAEMTKHALNAFLATSATFINEIATLCEKVGADASEVERGLKSEARIGPKAYLGPGAAFAGGTLARDIKFLIQLGIDNQLPVHLFKAVSTSNNEHKYWLQHRLTEILGDLKGRKDAIWGLTYKPGTDTLRRSSAIELCYWLVEKEVSIQAHDPVVTRLPDNLGQKVLLYNSPIEAVRDADVLIVATEWPEYTKIRPEEIVGEMKNLWVLDANRFLRNSLGVDPRIHYISVGKAL